MKIAIQGHPTRGKEIISLLESLGSIQSILSGDGVLYTYYIINNIIRYGNAPKDYKVYTLEEFEKEFPFKIGDKVIALADHKSYKIIALEYFNDKLCYVLDNGFHYRPQALKLYKEMKEERNITLTLDKAKEWYKKGGELREIALQAFNEKELNPLPKSWEEFCAIYSKVDDKEYFIDYDSNIEQVNSAVLIHNRLLNADRNICPSKKSAEAHLAMIQLEQLRNCYNDNSEAWGWSYSIIKRNGIPELVRGCDHDTFLRFNNETIATQFLKNFKDLIEKAGDLI